MGVLIMRAIVLSVGSLGTTTKPSGTAWALAADMSSGSLIVKII